MLHDLTSTLGLELLVTLRNKGAEPMFACVQALHKFLDVMSVFDWEQHCVSMTGRVLLASFPTYQGAHLVTAPAAPSPTALCALSLIVQTPPEARCIPKLSQTQHCA